MEPMGFSWEVGVGGGRGGTDAVRAGWHAQHLRLGAGVGGVAPFGVEELAEPADLALGGLLAVPLQRRGVRVEALSAAGVGAADAFEVLLDPRAAPLEDADPHVALGAGEEREAHVEAVVVPRGGVGPGDEPGEVLLAGCGQLVDHSGPLPAGGDRVGRLRDEPAVEQPLERRVERAVGQGAEGAEGGVEAAAQVVPVRRTLVEEPEDRELEELRATADHGILLWSAHDGTDKRAVCRRDGSTDISERYIANVPVRWGGGTP